MKKLVLTAISCFVVSFSYAQNLFPASGNVGIGTTNPVSLFQVNGYAAKTSIGDASGAALAYGTNYIGFNAGRNSAGWTMNQDGANNGGAIIYSSIFGDIYFCNIETTGAADKILSDAEIRSRMQFHIYPRMVQLMHRLLKFRPAAGLIMYLIKIIAYCH